jgi:hypothetical protein
MADPRDPDDEPTEVSGVTGRRTSTTGGSAKTLAPGRILGHTYRIEALLGRGGMGEVYRARHIELNTQHAIKIILPELADTQLIVDLFRREAANLRTIRNDVIVGYEGVFRDETGRLYLVMEYVEGPSLAKVLKQGPLRPAAVRQLRDRLASGLAAAHDKGVFHRDLSPDNVILPGDSLTHAKIIDFGISKVADPAAKTIIGDTFAGKYSYVSPEQLGMFGGAVDARSDIYSLGLVLAAAAIGEPLNMGASPSTAVEARQAVPNLERVPADLRKELSLLLQPDPADRPQSMREILRRAGVGERPVEPKPPRQRWPRVALASGALVVLLGIAAYLLWPRPDDLGTMARRAVEGLGCSPLSIDVSAAAEVTVLGYVADESARGDIVARLRQVPGVAGVADRTEVLSPPLCEAIRMIVTETTADAGAPSVPRIDRGGQNGRYRKDQLLRINVSATAATAGHLAIDLIDVAGASVFHFLPNAQARPQTAVAGGGTIEIGTLGFEKEHYKVQEPFGKALVIALWTREPLFPTLRSIKEADTGQYLLELRARLRELGRDAVFGSFSVLTLEP